MKFTTGSLFAILVTFTVAAPFNLKDKRECRGGAQAYQTYRMCTTKGNTDASVDSTLEVITRELHGDFEDSGNIGASKMARGEDVSDTPLF